MLSASAFCAAKDSYSRLTWIMYGCVAVLLIAASGWRPRLTALPHAYVNYSVFSGIAINDGGDQVALILSVLFVLPSLGDARPHGRGDHGAVHAARFAHPPPYRGWAADRAGAGTRPAPARPPGPFPGNGRAARTPVPAPPTAHGPGRSPG